MIECVSWHLLWLTEELEPERQQGSSLRNRCFMVFLLGLDGGLPGNNQSQQRLEADTVTHIQDTVLNGENMSQTRLKYFESLVRATWHAQISLLTWLWTSVKSKLFGEHQQGWVKWHMTEAVWAPRGSNRVPDIIQVSRFLISDLLWKEIMFL